MKHHSYSCPYPEGCNCGATEFNALEQELNEACDKIKNLSTWSESTDRVVMEVENQGLRTQLAESIVHERTLRETIFDLLEAHEKVWPCEKWACVVQAESRTRSVLERLATKPDEESKRFPEKVSDSNQITTVLNENVNECRQVMISSLEVFASNMVQMETDCSDEFLSGYYAAKEEIREFIESAKRGNLPYVFSAPPNNKITNAP